MYLADSVIVVIVLVSVVLIGVVAIWRVVVLLIWVAAWLLWVLRLMPVHLSEALVLVRMVGTWPTVGVFRLGRASPVVDSRGSWVIAEASPSSSRRLLLMLLVLRLILLHMVLIFEVALGLHRVVCRELFLHKWRILRSIVTNLLWLMLKAQTLLRWAHKLLLLGTVLSVEHLVLARPHIGFLSPIKVVIGACSILLWLICRVAAKIRVLSNMLMLRVFFVAEEMLLWIAIFVIPLLKTACRLFLLSHVHVTVVRHSVLLILLLSEI